MVLAERLRTGLTGASVTRTSGEPAVSGTSSTGFLRGRPRRGLAGASSVPSAAGISALLLRALFFCGASVLSIPSPANSGTFFLAVRLRGAGEEPCSVPETSAAAWDSAGASAADLALRTIRFLGDGSGETCSGVKSGGVSDMEKKIGLQQQASPERQRR